MGKHPKAPESTTDPHSGSLALRAERYVYEVGEVVRAVGEHPLYELKRACDISHLPQKIEFVKDIQAIATSRIEFEKYLVIGADEGTKAFVPVSDLAQFDEAKLRQILEKYLSPAPQFEVFKLTSAEGTPFVLIVIGKQKTRRILVRATVDDPDDRKPRILIREGDLWTKAGSTGKRLARPEDWDDIYEEFVERESEARTRRRTDQVMQQVVAQERLRVTSGTVSVLPAYLGEGDFKTLVESLCVNVDDRRRGLLLEKLRDDLIEGWHSCGAYDDEIVYDPQALREECRAYLDARFLPAIQRLTNLGMIIVKNDGPSDFFAQAISLLRETFDVSHHLHALRLARTQSTAAGNIDEYLSHTRPAFEALLSVHIIGAYITKRRRFSFIRTILNQPVHIAGRALDSTKERKLMAMWPLRTGWGEPVELQGPGGHIELGKAKIVNDPTFLALFGSETRAVEAMVQFDFLVEWNSYLAVDPRAPEDVTAWIRSSNPGIDFTYRPDLVAFSMRYLRSLAWDLFENIRSHSAGGFWEQTVLDPVTPSRLGGAALNVFLECLRAVEDGHQRWLSSMQRFGSFFCPWPKPLEEALLALPPETR